MSPLGGGEGSVFSRPDIPTTNSVACKNGRSVGTRTHCTQVFYARSEPTRMLSRCSSTKNSASELTRKFIKGVLLVGTERSTLSYPAPNHQRWHAKMEDQSEHVRIAHTFFFLHVPSRLACSVDAHRQKFPRRSSGGSSLRVRCWLG